MTTTGDRRVYESLTGFTDHDIEIIALAVGVPEETVYRLIDCIRFIKGQGLSDQRGTGITPSEYEGAIPT